MEESGRTSNEILIHESDDSQNLLKGKKKNKTTKVIIIAAIVFVALVILALILYFLLKDNSSDDWIPYNPIPDQEDLDFTEEAHRLLSREVAIQTMVLATNNGELPLEETDQVVLFGIGTENTIYGGWGSGEVYNKGTTQSLKPVTILEGIENAKDNFIYRENKIGYEIGLPESNLTEADVEKFAEKDEKAQRSVAILTISRRSGEGSDRPQDQSNVGTLLSDTEINTYNALIKYFDKVVVVLNVGSVIELNDIEKNEKTSILISFLPGM